MNNNNNKNKTFRINYKDNIKILKYYNIDVPKSKNDIKKTANKIISDKLCRCINKLGTDFEERSIGICTKTIFNNKGLKRGTFKCNGKNPTIEFRKFYKIKTKTKKNKN
jgi:hypothetical protein